MQISNLISRENVTMLQGGDFCMILYNVNSTKTYDCYKKKYAWRSAPLSKPVTGAQADRIKNIQMKSCKFIRIRHHSSKRKIFKNWHENVNIIHIIFIKKIITISCPASSWGGSGSKSLTSSKIAPYSLLSFNIWKDYICIVVCKQNKYIHKSLSAISSGWFKS